MKRAQPMVVGSNRSNGYDLAVVYRICPRVSKLARSLPFGDDKLGQAGACLASFRDSLGQLKVKLWAILDGCPPEYRDLFEHYFPVENLVFIELNSAGNAASWSKQIDLLLTQQDAEYVYFAEDDYLYLPGQFSLMLDFLRTHTDVDFVTPYDHPDYYNLELHNQAQWMRVFKGRHWRTTSSTCLTFLGRTSALARYEKVFRSFAKGNADAALWLSLTKKRVFNPFLALRFFMRKERYWKILLKAWLYCWPQILFGKKAELWVPVPGVATHLCEGLLSPGVDWVEILLEHGSRDEKTTVIPSARLHAHGL